MSALPPLPEPPPGFAPEALPSLDDAALDELLAAIAVSERATVAAMAPHQAQLKELRARAAEIATERRRRERTAQIAARAAVREQAKSGEMPSVVEALASTTIPDDRALAEVAAFLKSGGEVRFGYATRPGALAFTDGRRVSNATTWGDARRLYREGWEPGAPGNPGVRVHLVGTRVERVVDASEVVVRTP